MRGKGDIGMKNIYEINRRIEYLKYCSDRIYEINYTKIDEVPFTQNMFSYGTLRDSTTISSFLPFDTIPFSF